MIDLRFVLMGTLLTVASVHASPDVACEQECFDDYKACADTADVFFISGQECGQEQIACRLSCNSGRKMKEYRDLGQFSYSFRPMLEHVL